jgi:serine/tyrosine/threonine adenylyltransferase
LEVPTLPLSAAHPATLAPVELGLRFDNSYARLPPAFYTRLAPTALPDPYLVAYSDSAARTIGLDPDALHDHAAIEALAGNRPIAGTEPLAAVYSGHQFGVYVPRLGDGRALLLGEAIGPTGEHWELQLKGSGKTPYSRMGDGRAVLRSSIREFLCSEAMHHLGIPTTRALAVIGSDAPVFRETVETAAVVTRMSPTFVRFGSFEYFYWTQQHDLLRQLADYVIERHYPECRDAARPYLALLEQVARRTARLVAQWQGVGFAHGVLNTDNMSILGITIDYGPFGFVDQFDAGYICNHSDEQGRYAYNMQPQIAHWNLYALGQALIALTEDIEATKAAIDTYSGEYARAVEAVFHAKLGLADAARRRRSPDEPGDRTATHRRHRLDDILASPRAVPLGAGLERPGARSVRRSRGVRRLGGGISRQTAGGRQCRCRARCPHERSESEVRAAQPSCRDRDPQGAR